MIDGTHQPLSGTTPGSAWRFLRGIAAGCLACALLASCRREGGEETTAAQAGYRREFERGPVRVVVGTDRREATIADRIRLTIEAFADEAYEVELPRFGEKLEQFGIVDYHTSQPALVDDSTRRVGRSYVLEPFLSGEYTIPPMTVRFSKSGEDTVHTLETEPMTISIASLLDEEVAELDIRDDAAPVEIPRPPLPWGWLGGGAGAALLAAAGVVWWLRRRRPSAAAAAAREPAHLAAFRALEALVAEDLVGQGRVKAFYQGVSGILRTYIENRFGLHAPEQTTEEFLLAIRSGSALPAEYRPLLEEFLAHCDMVKFAELQPTSEQIQKTFDSCKSFIAGTAPAGEGAA